MQIDATLLAVSSLLLLLALAQNWEGQWQGTLQNFPTRPNSKPVDVNLEIGALPKTANSCTTWRTTYSESGQVRQVKDYRLCRGNSSEDWFLDEGNGIKLAAQWIGDVLVCPFKYDKLLLITTTRLQGDTLEEEILTIDDQPASTGVLPLKARNIQRLRFQRKESNKK
jgi:hypothetical protein